MRSGSLAVTALVALAAGLPAQDRTQGSLKNEPELQPSPGAEREKESAPAPAERYDPRGEYVWHKGDKRRMVQSMKAEHLVTFLQRGKPVHVENKTDGFELRILDHVTELAPGGWVRKIDRTYERVKDFATGKEERRPRTVTMDFGGERVKVIRDEEELPPIVAEQLESAEKRNLADFAYLFPEQATVEIGQEWEIPPAAVARLWLLDEEQLAAGESSCTGRLAAKRTVKGVEQVKLVLHFRLRTKKLWGDSMEFDPPAQMDWVIEVWSAARGEHPDEECKLEGTLEGQARLKSEKVPPDVKVQVKSTCAGTIKTSLVAATR